MIVLGFKAYYDLAESKYVYYFPLNFYNFTT